MQLAPRPQSPRAKVFIDKIKSQVQHVTAEELIEQLAENPKLILIDVREADEYKQGSLHNAIGISRGLLEWKIEDCAPDADVPIVLYCGSGARSSLAAFNLQEMGYSNVKSLVGGYKGWCAQGLPVTGLK